MKNLEWIKKDIELISSEIEREDLNNLLKFEYSEDNSEMKIDFEESQSNNEEIKIVLYEEMSDFLQRTKIRMRQRLAYLRETNYTKKKFLLEFSLIHFQFFHIVSNEERMRLKEKANLIRVIKIYIKELNYLIQQIKKNKQEFDFSSKIEFAYSVKINVNLRNMLSRMIMNEAYFKIRGLGGKRKLVNVSDLFIELYFKIFGIGIPSENVEDYELFQAVYDENIDKVKKILSFENWKILYYNVNQTDLMGITPLQLAIKRKNPRIVELLLESGAFIFEKSLPYEKSAYECALETRSSPIIYSLLTKYLKKLSVEDFNKSTFSKSIFLLTPISNFDFYVQNPSRVNTGNSKSKNYYTHVIVRKDESDLRIRLINSKKKKIEEEISEEQIRDSMELKISGLNTGFFHFTLKKRGSLRGYKINNWDPLECISDSLKNILQRGKKVEGLVSFPREDPQNIELNKKKSFLGFSTSNAKIMKSSSVSHNIVKKVFKSKSTIELVEGLIEMTINRCKFQEYFEASKNYYIFPMDILNMGVKKATDSNENLLANFLLFFSGDKCSLKHMDQEEIENFNSMMEANKQFKKCVEVSREKNSSFSSSCTGSVELIHRPPLTNTMIYHYLWLLMSFDFANFEIFKKFKIIKTKVDKMIPGIIRVRDSTGLKSKLRFYYFSNLKLQQEIIEFQNNKTPLDSNYLSLPASTPVSARSPQKYHTQGYKNFNTQRNYSHNLSLVEEEDNESSSRPAGLKPYLTLPDQELTKKRTKTTASNTFYNNQLPSEFLKSHSTFFMSHQSSFRPQKVKTIFDKEFEISDFDLDEFYSPKGTEFNVFTKGDMISYNSSRIKTMRDVNMKNEIFASGNLSLNLMGSGKKFQNMFSSPQKNRARKKSEFSFFKKNPFRSEKKKKSSEELENVPNEKADWQKLTGRRVRTLGNMLPSMRARNSKQR